MKRVRQRKATGVLQQLLGEITKEDLEETRKEMELEVNDNSNILNIWERIEYIKNNPKLLDI